MKWRYVVGIMLMLPGVAYAGYRLWLSIPDERINEVIIYGGLYVMTLTGFLLVGKQVMNDTPAEY